MPSFSRLARLVLLGFVSLLFAAFPVGAEPSPTSAPASAKPTPAPASAKPSPATASAIASPPPPPAVPPLIRVYQYELLSGSQPMGSMERKETHYGQGRVVVDTSSSFDVRVFFVRRKGTTSSRAEYKNGVLVSFESLADIQGRKAKTWGKRDSKGLTISRQDAGKAVKTVVLPEGSFDTTSQDLRTRIPKIGTTITLKQAMIDQQKVVIQTIKALQGAERLIGKQRLPVVLLEAKGPRGTASLVLFTDGNLVESTFRSLFGTLLTRLKQIR